MRKQGTQHNSQMFETIYTDKSIAVSLAPTKHQKSKYFTETIWQFLRKIAQLMMVHAKLAITCSMLTMNSIYFIL